MQREYKTLRPIQISEFFSLGFPSVVAEDLVLVESDFALLVIESRCFEGK